MIRSLPRAAAGAAMCALLLAAAPAARAQVTPAASAPAASSLPPYAKADADFMYGMVIHHAQAVLMAGWAPTHGASPAVREVCDRIAVSQRDEIGYMERWLRERHEAVPRVDTMPGPGMPAMPGMSRMMMPGMLTDAQLAQLDSARGPRFDRLFLVGMISHHEGALTMVHDLMNTPGAAQDPLIFEFSSEISAGQAAEIDRMRHLLAALPATDSTP
jgi:uncharacterized protein (DUF305 family)